MKKDITCLSPLIEKSNRCKCILWQFGCGVMILTKLLLGLEYLNDITLEKAATVYFL